MLGKTRAKWYDLEVVALSIVFALAAAAHSLLFVNVHTPHFDFRDGGL